MFIDLETVFKLVYSKMSHFLEDIVVFNKGNQQKHAVAAIDLLNEKNVCYMAHDYTNIDLRINSHFLDPILSGNLYDWANICIFHHHDLCTNPTEMETMRRRVSRFNAIMEEDSAKTCLFHITKINTIANLRDYMSDMIRMKESYSILAYVIVIVCCDNLDHAHYFEKNMLFIIKNVAPYATQIKQGSGSDNEMLNCTREIDVMKTYFHFDLTSFQESE
jgi:hypothetical protein